MATPPNPSDIRYGGFYLPVFSLLYVHQEIGLPVELPLHFHSLVLTEGNFLLFSGMTFLGALFGHGASRSIYGIEGARRNPKNRWAVLWYRLLFTLKKTPGKPPTTVDHLQSKVEKVQDWYFDLSVGKKILVTLVKFVRSIVILAAKTAFISMVFLTTWTLGNAAISGSLGTLGAILLVAQFLFFFGSWAFNRFPTAVPLDAAPWLYLAEYHKAELLHERGKVDFEYGPFDLTKPITGWLLESERRIFNRPHYVGKEDIDWVVPLEDNSTKYVVPLEEETTNSESEHTK
jgi:hypothetical protein